MQNRQNGSLKFTRTQSYGTINNQSEGRYACAISAKAFLPQLEADGVQMALTIFFCQQKKSLHPVSTEGHAAARSMKLLAKIPKDAEATVVLVGKLRSVSFQRLLCSGPEMMLSHSSRVFQ